MHFDIRKTEYVGWGAVSVLTLVIMITWFLSYQRSAKQVDLLKFSLAYTTNEELELTALAPQVRDLITDYLFENGEMTTFSVGSEHEFMGSWSQFTQQEISKSIDKAYVALQQERTYLIIVQGVCIILCLLSLGVSGRSIKQQLIGKIRKDRLSISETQHRLIKFKEIYVAAIESKKLLVDKVTLLQEERADLQKRVKDADAMQAEMKNFVDVQIKTNEQLMIAESKLKNLLEKEKEGKAIMNQTIDKLKETQGQLVHSEKMASLGQLTAGIAHEINNPINFVYNGVGSVRSIVQDLSDLFEVYKDLEAEGPNEEILEELKNLKEDIDFHSVMGDLHQLLKDIEEGAIRTIEIVKGLRVFSRLDEEDKKYANINECLEATLILLKNKLKNRITLEKQLDTDIQEISCYPGQLNQVFMNILTNAIQAIPEESKEAKITVKTEESMDQVWIRLIDNGSGMSEEVKRRIFEPFFTTKPVGVGTGLGMSISYGIIEKHHGRIQVNSELGKGTEFIIVLPKTPEMVYSTAV